MLRRLESITYTLFLFLTPLLVTFFSKELFEFPKTNFLYLITGLMLLISTWKFRYSLKFFEQNKSVKIFFGSIFAILASNLISLIFSIDIYTSIFGYYTRFNGGIASLLCILIWILIIANKKLSTEEIEKSVLIIFLSGMVVSIYAVIQKLGLDSDLWKEDSSNRVFSTLGQPNWLAAYLIPIFYISIYIVYKKANNVFARVIPLLIIYLAILFTNSISGLLAFSISTLGFLLLNRHETLNAAKRYWYLIIIVLGLTVTLALPYKVRITEQISNLNGIIGLLKTDSSQNLAPNYGDTGKIRLILWDGTINLITSSPKQFLIGSGPETFAYAFPKFRPDSINATSEATFVHNKPHNWYLEIFANLGLVGILSYLGFILSTLYLFYKSNKTFLSKILFCGWISILITNFFGWPTVPLSILFFIMPIFMHYRLLNFSTDKEQTKTFEPLKIFAPLLLANLLILSAIIFTVSDFYYKNSEYDQAHKLNPFEKRYELFHLIYDKEVNPAQIRSFYYLNKHNPYIVKTLFSYVDQLYKRDLSNEEIENLREEIANDAKRNSPNDLQFR